MENVRDLIRAIGRIERRLLARARSLIRRGTAASVDSTGQGQVMQAKTLADQVRDKVEIFEQYGFTSSPQPGGECLILNVGGDTGHAVAILCGGRARPAGINPGEVAVYQESGSAIVLRTDGSIEVYPADGMKVKLGATGGLPVARETDPVEPAPDFQTWITAVSSAVATMAAAFNVAGPLVGAPGTIAPSVIADLVAPSDFGLIEAGGDGSEST